MAAPEGYTKLGNVGYADKGVYSADATYNKYNVVYYEGSTYVALKDNLHGVTPANGENWRYMAKGFNEASADGITVIDTSGIIDGTKKKKTILQTFLDKVGDFIINKAVTNEALLLKLADYLKKTDIVQTESTATNKVPSSAYLKQVKADINSNLEMESGVATINADWATGSANYYKIGKQCVVNALVTLKQDTTVNNTLLISGLLISAQEKVCLIHGTTGYGVFKVNANTGNITIDSGAKGNSIFYFEMIYPTK